LRRELYNACPIFCVELQGKSPIPLKKGLNQSPLLAGIFIVKQNEDIFSCCEEPCFLFRSLKDEQLT
jgi:hypothetical protein